MPQFDLIANYYLIWIFYILFFSYFVAYISIINTIFKFTKVFLLMKEHKNSFKGYIKSTVDFIEVKRGWNIKIKSLLKCN